MLKNIPAIVNRRP